MIQALKSLAAPTRLQKKVGCPYCHAKKTISLPNYAPRYVDCAACGKRFIVERTRDGLDVFTLEAVPRSSDPDYRESEMSSGQEE